MASVATSNFSFLGEGDPSLLEIALVAERSFTSDPNTTVVKLRQLAEQLSKSVATRTGITYSRETDFFDLIAAITRKLQLDAKVARLLHHLRKCGNDAVHEYEQDHRVAIDCLRSARELCLWYYRAFGSPRRDFSPGPFVSPRDWQQEEADLRQEVARLREQLEDERRSAAESRDLLAAVRTEEEKLRRLAEERLRDVEASFELAEEQSREVERLRKRFEASDAASETMAFSLALDRGSLVMRAQEAAEHVRADWTPEIALADAFGDESLTDEQARLVEELERFLKDPLAKVFLMTGFAGTGKTFITRGLSGFLEITGRNFVLAAPTGKAARVLTQKSGQLASTIHKKIYSTNDLKEYKVQDLDGSETYKFYAELSVNNDPDNTVYVVDEASMVSDVYSEGEFFRFGTGHLLSDLVKYINLDHNDHDKKLIFIGDSAQLPPIGMRFSPALDASYLRKTFGFSSLGRFELTQVVRHGAKSGILKSAGMIREAIGQKVFTRLEVTPAPDVSPLDDRQVMVSAYLHAIGGKVSDDAMMIAWSNSEVASLNEAARRELFPGSTTLSPRDKLVVVMNWSTPDATLANGDLVYVLEMDDFHETRLVNLRKKNEETGEVVDTEVSLQFRGATLGYRDPAGEVQRVYTRIIENLLFSDEPNLSSDESKALYVDFRVRNPRLPKSGKELRDALRGDPYFNALRVKFGYALTCHKAQGSEWDVALVDCNPSGRNMRSEDYFRWLYTAVTRAKKELHVLNLPRFTPWSDVVPEKKNGGPAKGPPAEAKSAAPLEPSVDEQRQDAGGFSQRLHSAVLAALKGLPDIRVEGVDHHAYQEAYYIADSTHSERFNISYNAAGVVRRVLAARSTALSERVLPKLSSLEGVCFAGGDSPVESDFSRPVFNDFYPVFSAAAEANGLRISGVKEEAWNLRFKVEHGTAAAEVAIYCDGKGRIKPPAWIGRPPRDTRLLDAFQRTLESLT